MTVSPHVLLALAVTDIEATRAFYAEKLGYKVGRSAERWIDFEFFLDIRSVRIFLTVRQARPKPT